MFLISPGIWRGTYRYDSGSGREPVPFEMVVEATGPRSFAGTIRSAQFPESGSISGVHGIFSCSFSVQYPRLMVVMEDSRVLGLREFVREEFRVEPRNDLPHPRIDYRASRSLRRSRVAGTWKMPHCSIVDQESGWRLDFPTMTGTWRAERSPGS